MFCVVPAFVQPALLLGRHDSGTERRMQSLTRPRTSTTTTIPTRRPRASFVRMTSKRGPTTPKPDYSSIDGNPVNALLMDIFRSKLEVELRRNSAEPLDSLPSSSPSSSFPSSSSSATQGFDAVVEVVRALTRRHRGNAPALRAASRRVLVSLFPAWLLPAYRRIISGPIPRASAWLNAVVTVAVTQWLMGPSRLASTGEPTVEIDRCRYLEETGCVGVCVNSCKSATEQFFTDEMALDLHIEPNLEDYSCKFHFGRAPPPPSEDPMYIEPCFAMCPSASSSTTAPCHAVGKPVTDDSPSENGAQQ